MKNKWLACIFSIFFGIPLCNAGTGTSSAVFLKDVVGARPLGMGSAFSAVSDDANSIYSNPAGIHYVPYSEITTMYRKGLMDTYFSYLGYLHPFKRIGTFSASFLLFDGGDMEINYLDGTTEEVKAGQDWAGTLGYGTNIGELFFLGTNIKLIHSTLVNRYSATAFALDAGGLYRTIDNKFSVALSFYNLGTSLKYINVAEPLPLNFKLGTAYRILEDEIHSLLSAIDFIYGNDKTFKTNIGAEYWLLRMFALRIGVKLEEGYKPNGFTVGLGINAFNGELDYGYAPLLDEITHRISLSFKFGSQDKVALAKKYEEKGMYERAQYIRSPVDYMYAKAKTEKERNKFLPVITSIEPERASPGSEISIYGAKFGNKEHTVVKFGDYNVEPIESDSKRIKVKVPNIKAGDIEVIVTTNERTSESEKFSVMPLKPPMLKATNISFDDENKNEILDADENGKIILEIQNQNGAGESFGLEVIPVCSNSEIELLSSSKILIGDISSGEQKQVVIPIKGRLNLPTGENSFTLNFTEANGFNPEPVVVKFKTHKLEPPDIQLAEIEIDDKVYPDKPEKLSVGNNNGIIEPGESVEVVATIINKGTGPTKDGILEVICNDSKITLLTNISKFDIVELKPSESKDIKFVIRVEKQYKGTEDLPIRLNFTEARKLFDREVFMNIKLGMVYTKIEEVNIEGKPTITGSVPVEIGANVDIEIPNLDNKNNDAIGIIIGIRDYKNKNVPLVEYALNDAKIVKEYLIKTLGYREGNIISLENPTKGDFESVFGTRESYKGRLFNYVKAGDSDVFIYYSGHGAPDIETKSAYFVPSDCDPNYVELNGYSLDLFYENISKIKARNMLVVIDACFSGISEKGVLIAQASGLTVNPVSPIIKGSNINIFTSSDKDEISSWYTEKRHGLFTYFFLSALMGEGNLDKDRKLTLGEVRDYINKNVPYLARRMYGRSQTPLFIGDENKVLVNY